MRKIIFGMVLSALLSATGILNMWLIIKKGDADPTESLLSFAPIVIGFLLFLFFNSKRERIIDLNMEYPKRRGLL